jgi:hypothetical protein
MSHMGHRRHSLGPCCTRNFVDRVWHNLCSSGSHEIKGTVRVPKRHPTMVILGKSIIQKVHVPFDSMQLDSKLAIPPHATGLVVFSHGMATQVANYKGIA